MAKHYAMRNKISRDKLKRAHAKIEGLTHQKEKDKLEMLVEASIHAYSVSTPPMSTIFEDLDSVLAFGIPCFL